MEYTEQETTVMKATAGLTHVHCGDDNRLQ